jgi:hypothetical protein
MSIPDTYANLLSYLCQALPALRRTQRRNLALWVWGLLRARHCALGRVADALPIEGTKASRIRRLKRWLMNSRIVADTIYGPLVQRTLTRWHRPELTLVLDRTEWDVGNVLLVGVAVLGRVLPLAWTVLSHQGNSDFREQRTLLERVRLWLPSTPQKAILGDGVELMRYAQAQGWDFGLGQSADTRFQGPSGVWQRLGDLQVPQTHPVYLRAIRLTREHAFGPVNLIAYWDRAKREQRYVATSRPATRATFTWGRQRSWIEGTFRDDKSGGFNLEDTHLTETDRLHRLLLVMAIGYLWCFHVGRWLFKTGQRKLMDAAKWRTLSYFRLGLDWICRAINIGEPLKMGFAVYT